MTGSRPPRVLICHDHMVDALLHRASAQFSAWGIEVIRGLPNTPGDITVYDAGSRELFENVDVAVFSSRNQCGRETLASAASLHAVVNPTIGVEKLDVEAASELGIIVGNGATPENYLGMAESSVMLMLNLMYGLLALAVLIALISIANSISLSIHERTHELGLLRAVGMTRHQVGSTVRWEAGIVSTLGAGLGIVMGVGFGWAISVALRDDGLFGASIPVAQLIVIAVFGVLGGVLASLRPAWRGSHLEVLPAVAGE